jgi:tRNA U55 pseudouridine synthase TruB
MGDIGEELGKGAYLAELRRTRVGDFDEQRAKTIEEFEKEWSSR